MANGETSERESKMIDHEQFIASFFEELRCSTKSHTTTDAAKDLQDGLERALLQWPAIVVDPSVFARYLLERTDHIESKALERLSLEDLYLACACLKGQNAAIEALAELAEPVITSAVRSFEMGGFDGQEMVHSLLHTILYGAPGKPAKLLSYRGEGNIRKWLKVVATRHALNLQRHESRRVEWESDEFEHVEMIGGNPEIGYLQQRYGESLRPALKHGLASLDAKSRNILRLYYQDRLTGEELGRLYQVHRTTISRWIQAAHEDLSALTFKRLADTASVKETEIESILRYIRSHLELSLRSIFDIESLE